MGISWKPGTFGGQVLLSRMSSGILGSNTLVIRMTTSKKV
jgi:hypothetical protein